MFSSEAFADTEFRAIQTMFVNERVDIMRVTLSDDFLLIGGQIASRLVAMLGGYAHFCKKHGTGEYRFIAGAPLDLPESAAKWHELISEVRKFCGNEEAYMAYVLSRISERMSIFIHDEAKVPWTKANPYRS